MNEPFSSRNPSTLSPLRQLEQTALSAIPEIVGKARDAQQVWAQLPAKTRCQIIRNAREHILENIDDIAALIQSENGKPQTEAIIHDILPVCELMTTYVRRAPDLLRKKRLPLRVMLHRASYLHYWPVGVVAVIAPWNFPFSIPFGEVVLALLSGNAVIMKPSEVTPLVGLKIAEVLEHAGLPKNIFQIVLGDGLRGHALVTGGVDKVFFTGSVPTGKKVMAAAAESLTPVILELGGKDPMIVMPDANLDFATSAALWGSFANSGQACASTERIIVHESIHDDFVRKLAEKAGKLRRNTSSELSDLGSITFDRQKEIYKSQLAELNDSNSNIVCGGDMSPDGTFLGPTVVTNPPGSTVDDCPLEKTKLYREETFGPIVAVTKYKTSKQAVEKANDTQYGLLASIIGKDTAMAMQMAEQIRAGSVLINEVLYTHGLPETPWGGVKQSGFGRVHSDLGFYEFVNVRHIHKERWSFLVFKSLWWFPYSRHQLAMFRHLLNFLYRRSWLRRALALPNLLVEFVEMIKTEKRL